MWIVWWPRKKWYRIFQKWKCFFDLLLPRKYYKSNILLLFYSQKIIFLILYPDLNSYDFTDEFELNIENIPEYYYEDYENRTKEINPRIKIIKVNSNCVAFFQEFKLYYAFLNDNIYYQTNKEIEAYYVKKDATDVIPIYYYNSEKKGVKELIVLSATNVGVVYNEINDEESYEDKMALEQIAFEVFLYDDNFAMKEFFKIYINCERIYYSKIFDIYSIYSYSNNFLYIFIGNNIFQLNLFCKEITTIYEILPIPIRKFMSVKENFKVIKLHFPVKNKIKELILLNYCFLNIVYVYEINEFELNFIKEFNFSNFSDYIEFNIFEMSNELKHYPDDLEKIIINSDFIRCLK